MSSLTTAAAGELTSSDVRENTYEYEHIQYEVRLKTTIRKGNILLLYDNLAFICFLNKYSRVKS